MWSLVTENKTDVREKKLERFEVTFSRSHAHTHTHTPLRSCRILQKSNEKYLVKCRSGVYNMRTANFSFNVKNPIAAKHDVSFITFLC